MGPEISDIFVATISNDKCDETMRYLSAKNRNERKGNDKNLHFLWLYI